MFEKYKSEEIIVIDSDNDENNNETLAVYAVTL